MKQPYRIVGAVSLKSGPGFATPVFQPPLSNGAFVQDIGDADVIGRFLRVSEKDEPKVESVNSERFRFIGEEALYVYRDSESNVHVDTRNELKPRLYSDFDHLSGFPYLRRSIAQFLDDKELSHQADLGIAERRLARSRGIEPKASGFDFPGRLIPEAALAFQEALKGANIVITGEAGTGKTFLMQSISNALRERDAHIVHVTTGARRGSPIDTLVELDWHNLSTLTRLFSSPWFSRPRGAWNTQGHESLRERAVQDVMNSFRRASRRTILIFEDVGISTRTLDEIVLIARAAQKAGVQYLISLQSKDEPVLINALHAAGAAFTLVTLGRLNHRDLMATLESGSNSGSSAL